MEITDRFREVRLPVVAAMGDAGLMASLHRSLHHPTPSNAADKEVWGQEEEEEEEVLFG